MEVAVVKFNNHNRKQHYKNTNKLKININDAVIVETDQGLELAIIDNLLEFDDKQLIKTLLPIIKLANLEEIETYNTNEEEVKFVINFTNEKIKELNLDMAVLNANYTIDRERLTIYFKADQRVDFRDLVKEISRKYQTRIELRQVGARDIAKMIGGIGPCGLVLCCNKFIGEFDAVTIKMAKNQELSLNPRNISGICGKLLCCLKYEDEVYEELKMLLPDLGSKVETAKGMGKVTDINFISHKIKVNYFDQELSSEWLDYRLIKE